KMTVGFRDRSITHPQLGQRLELQCESSKEDSGVFWVRLDKDHTLHFIVYISSLPRTVFQGNQQTSPRFEATKDRRFYRLVVKSFTSQDEGYYFCLMNSNQVLYFSQGQPAFFPVIPTVAPTTQRAITENDSCLKTQDQDFSDQNVMTLFCDIVVWVPLAGACVLLLIALLVTILLCQ
ncbi:CD8A protein, partial [Centropus unirufus]|nr:CD8A protein [Centropus unirufus]